MFIHTVGTVPCTWRCVAPRESYYLEQYGEKIRRALRNGARHRDSSCASQCVLLGDMERHRTDTALPEREKTRKTKSGETEVQNRKVSYSKVGVQGMCVGLSVSICR